MHLTTLGAIYFCFAISDVILEFNVLQLETHMDIVFISKDIPETLREVDGCYIDFMKHEINPIFSQQYNILYIINYEDITDTITTLKKIKNANYDGKYFVFVNLPYSFNTSSIHHYFSEAGVEYRAEDTLCLIFRSMAIDRYYRLYTSNGVLSYDEVMSCWSIGLINANKQLIRVEKTYTGEFDYPIYENESTIDIADSLNGKILDIFKLTLNFTIEARRSQNFDKLLPNGSWLGVVDDVLQNKADLGVSTTTLILRTRAESVAYLIPIDEDRIVALFLPPDTNIIRDIFSHPFHMSLWAVVFLTWITLVLSMMGVTFLRKRYVYFDNEESKEATADGKFTRNSLMFVIATGTQQGWDEYPEGLSLRIIFICASATGVIAYAGYSAAIVSTLSTQTDPIQTPNDLLRSNLPVGFLDADAKTWQFDENTPDILSALFKQNNKKVERRVNVTRGVELLLQMPYVFISTRRRAYDKLKLKLNDSGICGVKEIQVLEERFHVGMFTAKNYPYRDTLRYLLTLIRERGVLWRLRKDYAANRNCLEISDSSGKPLGANDVFTAFMILIGGYLFSLIALIGEKILYSTTLKILY